MSLWNTVQNAASKSNQKAASKAKQVSEVKNLYRKIAALEKEIQKEAAQVGLMYVEACRSNSSISAEGQAIVDQIMKSQETLKQYQTEILRIKEGKVCPNCGAPVAEGYLFCKHCGCRQEEEIVQERFCGHCGAAIDPDAVFCIHCGQRADSPASSSSDKNAETGSGQMVSENESTSAQNSGEKPSVSTPPLPVAGIEEAESKPESRICPNCGAVAEADSVYCDACGILLP